MIPGGVPAHELFDRVAYAEKIGARSVYLLGGEPTEHPAFLELVSRADRVVERVAMLSLVYPFAAPGVAACAKAAGLDAVTAEIHAMDDATHTRVFGAGAWAKLRAGLDAIRDAGLEVSARVIVSPETVASLEFTLATLAGEGIRVDDVTVTDAALLNHVRRIWAGSTLAGP
jgi:MoaA/NifB/PqqE/SkfB family radical SAM enzyme